MHETRPLFVALLGPLLALAGCGGQLPGDWPSGTTGGEETGDFQYRAYLAFMGEWNGQTANGSAVIGFDSACAGAADDLNQNDAWRLREKLELQWGQFNWKSSYSDDPYGSLAPQKFDRGHIIENHAGFAFPAGNDDKIDTNTNQPRGADVNDLVYIATHGSPGELWNNKTSASTCTTLLSVESRLGQYCGQEAKILAFAASEVMSLPQAACNSYGADVDNDGWSEDAWAPECFATIDCVMQTSATVVLGFMDSPQLWEDVGADWAGMSLAGSSVGYAWLLKTHTDPIAAMAKNQPIAYYKDAAGELAGQRYTQGTLQNAASLGKISPNDWGLQWRYGIHINYSGESNVWVDKNGDPIPLFNDLPPANTLPLVNECPISEPSGNRSTCTP